MMEEYNRELSYSRSESRFADIRAQREQRTQTKQQKKTAAAMPAKNVPIPKGAPPKPEYEEDDGEAYYARRYASLYEPKPKRGLLWVMAAQTLVCAVLLGGLAGAKRVAPNSYLQIKAAYAQMMRTDMSAAQVWAAIKVIAANLKDEIYVSVPASGVADERTAEAATTQPPQTSAESGAKPPLDPDLQGTGAGGLDLSKTLAELRCTYAPLRTTASPALPLTQGRLTSLFGLRTHPLTKEADSFHTGLDIAAPQGSPIHAVFFGTVEAVGTSEYYGNYILLKHSDALYSFYGHCSQVLAAQGMVVRAGENIALVGSTGLSTGPHLHFEIRLNGVRCDPAAIFAENAYQTA